MAKGKSTWKYNKLLTGRRNYFWPGGPLFGTNTDILGVSGVNPNQGGLGIYNLGNLGSTQALHNNIDLRATGNAANTGTTKPTDKTGGSKGFLGLDWSNPFKGANGAQVKEALMSAAGTAVGQIGGGLIGGGLESDAGNFISGLSGIASAIPGPWGAAASAGLGLVGGFTNRLIGSKINKKNVAQVEGTIKNLSGLQSDASDFDTLSQTWGNTAMGTNFANSYIGKDGLFSNRAKKKAKSLRTQMEQANAWAQNTLENNANNIGLQQANMLEQNYAAYGGPLLFSDGGSIHIKPENRGKFTETKRRTGKTTEELTHSKNPLTRKRAIFALNSRHWNKHSNGGTLDKEEINPGLIPNKFRFGGNIGTLSINGGDFPMPGNFLSINNGGSHEANPYEGVQLGVDPEGTPNLVEEGETVFNDYVFSKRLKVPKVIKDKYKIRGTKGLTFAEMSKKLAKESEERPNDPISIRGLEAIMADLANAQEELREPQQVRQHALGGTLFSNGGKGRGNQVLNYNNRTSGLYFGLNPEQFNPYAPNGTINWDIMYGTNSPYTKRRQYVIDNWDTPGVQKWLDRYVEGINKYNESRSGYQPMTKSDITKDIFINRTWDKSWGGMHAGIDYAGDPEKNIIEKHMLRSLEGDPTDMPETDIYYPNTRGGYTWADRFSDKYTRANNGAYEESTDDNGNTVRTYYYDPVKNTTSTNRYYKKGTDGKYALVEGDNPYLDIQNSGNYNQVRSNSNNLGGTDYYYDPEKADPEYKKLPTGLRYAPAVGLGIAAITDAVGLTNKPDYSNAEAVLEASRNAGAYQPVRFNPIGNYLTYRPFDKDYYINKMNAEAGASRRALLNTSGGNRATAAAGILAADNNYLNQIGNLARQAEEYNLAQRNQVEEFNRGTNTTNSQGFLQADIANQKALADARGLSLNGAMTAAEMREKARLAADQAKSANLSGFVTALGDIGRENMAWNWRNFGLATDSYGNVGDEQYLLANTGKKKSNKGAKGGKMKRRKGLTI